MKKALFVWGGWNGHEPKACVDRFAPWLKDNKGFEVVIADNLEVFEDEALMSSLDLIIPVWTMGEISPAQWEGLKKAVLRGCGLAGWHGGMCDAFRQNVEYQFMTGGQWVVHLGGIVDYTVNIKRTTDGFLDGLNDFDMRSEQYYMHVDPGNENYAHTIMSGEYQDTHWVRGTVMPVVWKRKFGKGRVFYTSLVHVEKDLDVPEAMEIIKRGLQWAAQETVIAEYHCDEISKDGYQNTDV
jgi:type 1 glutamine amidotransferase